MPVIMRPVDIGADTSMAESFVDSFKTELIADRVWRTRSQGLPGGKLRWSPKSSPHSTSPLRRPNRLGHHGPSVA